MIKKLVFWSIIFATQITAPLSFYFSDPRAQKLSQQIAQSTDPQAIHTLIKIELAEYEKKVQQHVLDYCLACAVEQEDFGKAKLLLNFGANPNTRGFRHSRDTGADKTLLMERAECGSAAQVKFLLRHGAYTQMRDARGAHVWHHTVNNRRLHSASAIFQELRKHADKAQPDINYPGAHGDTALHEAARSAKLFFVRELLRLGADINAQDDKGFTPLDTVLDRARWDELEDGHKKDYLAVIQFLCERGASANYYNVSDFLPKENVQRIEQAPQFLVIKEKEGGWRAARSFVRGDGCSCGSSDGGGGDAYVLLEDGPGDCAQDQYARVGDGRSSSSERTCVIM